MASFLLSRKWILAHVGIVVFVAACVGLGLWQLDRLDQRRAHNRLLEERLALAPEPLEELLPAGSEPDPDAVAYRRVSVEGSYDAEREVILFGRTLDDTTGSHVLTPLVTEGGRALVVDRGWIPIELDRPPVGGAAAPAGAVRLTGVLFPPEAETPPADASRGALTTLGKVDLGELRAHLPYDLYPDYLWLLTQDPAQTTLLPRYVPLPEVDEGPHLGYAVQWFSFTAVALIGYAVIIRRERARVRSRSS